MKRRGTSAVVVIAMISLLTGCASTEGFLTEPPTVPGRAGVQDLAGTWHGLVTGREMAGGGLAQRATLVVQADGKWTLASGGARSEGTIRRGSSGVFELDGRFVPDGGRAAGRLEQVGDGLVGSVDTRFPLTGSMTTGIRLERERGEAAIQASPAASAPVASRFQGGQFAGAWLGLATGREMFGSGIVQPARLVVQPDGRWTLTTGGARSEGTISRITDEVLELDGRFVPDGGRAGARLERVGDGRLTGTVATRFLTGSMEVGIDLEREGADSAKASLIQSSVTISPLESGEVLQSP